MKKIKRFWKRLNTKLPEEIIWDDYLINNQTVNNLKMELYLLDRDNRILSNELSDTSNKVDSLKRYIISNLNAKDINFKLNTLEEINKYGSIYNIEIK